MNSGKNLKLKMYQKDLEFHKKWNNLLIQIGTIIGKKPKDMNGVLFLIGVHELGKGKRRFTKEEKQDLMHIAICKVLSISGYYRLEGIDQDGWPHWKMIKKLPHIDLLEQETLLKINIMEYFENEFNWK